MTRHQGDAIETLPLESGTAGSRPRRGAAGPQIADLALQPGALLLRRFEVRARVGEGGMGVVYEAWDRELGAAVALKFLNRAGPSALYRLKREFRAMNTLVPHPNLIAPSGLFCDGGLWFLSMELVRGEPWLSYTRPGGELDPHRLRSALSQLAHGLRALHLQGRVHRDLKPSNVLVGTDGRLVILDFGLMSDRDVDADPAARQGGSGTPRYMAPEQTRGEQATEASDCYALGVMLYEALTGACPFDPSGAPPAQAPAPAQAPIAPAQLAAGVPPELSQLCLSLLARAPAQRPGVDRVLSVLGEAPGQAPPPRSRPARSALVGRQHELSALRAALSRTGEGLPQLLLVEGESAVGKSALVETFIATLPDRTVALASRCHERADVPFKAWDDLIDELARFLAAAHADDVRRWTPQDLDALLQMFPVLGKVEALRVATAAATTRPRDPHELRRRGAAALRELLGRIAAEHPLVLFIDDLQWGDADSATLLRELLGAAFAPALLFVGAHRSEARAGSEFVRAVRALAGDEALPLRTLSLGPLPEHEARELAQALLGDRGGAALAARIAREAGGMPLFVRELSAQARDGLLGNLPQGTALAAAIAHRVELLPAPARAVLELVSIAHAPMPEAVVLGAAELGEGAPTVVRALGAQCLLRMRSDGRLDAYHDRVRESVAEAIAEGRKRALHAALAHALQRSDRPAPDALAAHALAAGLTELGLDATLQAATGAMQKLAFERAAAHLRSALSLFGEDDPRRDGALAQLAEALRLDGRGREAGDAYVHAAERASGMTRLARLRNASAMYLQSAYVDRGIDVMLPVLQTLGVSFPRSTRAVRWATLFELARVRLQRPFFRERDEAELDELALARIDACFALGSGLLSVWERRRFGLFLLRALRLSLQAGAARRAAYIDVVIASMPSGPRQLDARSQPVFERALRLARRHGDHELAGWTYTCRAVAYVWAMRPDPAIEQALLAKSRLEEAGAAGLALTGAEHALRLAAMLAGRLAELATASDEDVRRGRARSDLFGWIGARAHAALAVLAADQPDRALAELADALESFSAGQHWQRWREPDDPSQAAVLALLIRCWALSYRGDATAALAEVVASWPGLRRAGYLDAPCWHTLFVWLRGACALAAAPLGPAPEPVRREVTRALRELAGIETQPVARAFARLLRAGLAGLRGDASAARAELEAAACAFDAVHMRLFAASAQRRLGELTAGERGEALREAADARMRALGVACPVRWTAMYVPGLPPWPASSSP